MTSYVQRADREDALVKTPPAWRTAIRRHRQLYFMLIPSALLLIFLNYYPLWGIGIAFVDYNPFRGLAGSPFVGLDNFVDVFNRPQTGTILRNTLFIAIMKLVLGQVVAVIFALLVYEVRFAIYRRAVQTLTTLPYFLSWVVLGGTFVTILSSTGPLNTTLTGMGLEPIGFLRDQGTFPWTLILTDVWKNFGFGAIIYLAALTQINPELYEAAAVDGAGRWARMRRITLPGIMPTIILMAALNLGNVLNAGFEQILVLYNPAVLATGDVLDTYIFRIGLQGFNYEIGTVVGLLKSVVGFVMILTSYWLAARFANYRIF